MNNMMNKICMMLIVVVVLISAGCVDQKEEGEKLQAAATEQSNDVVGSGAEVIECGISTTSKDSELMPLSKMGYEEDSAMVCIGNSILDNCKKAKAIVDSKTGTLASYEVLGPKGKDCIIRIKYAGGTPLPENEKFMEDTYMECPMDIADLQAGDKRDYSQIPGLFAAELHMLVGFETINKDTKCTGTMLDAIRVERERMRAEIE